MTAFKKITEKRLEKRWSVDKPGTIYPNASSNEIPCQVLDWSARGAKLEFAETFDCPDEFILKIDFGKSIGAVAHGYIAWKHQNNVGVQFDEELSFDVETKN